MENGKLLLLQNASRLNGKEWETALVPGPTEQ